MNIWVTTNTNDFPKTASNSPIGGVGEHGPYRDGLLLAFRKVIEPEDVNG